MSAYVLANFLQKEAKTNQKLLHLLNRCVEKLEEREYLEKENAALEAECFRLDMEWFTMESHLEKIQEIDKVRERELETAKSVLADIVQTRLQFEQLDVNNLVQNKMDSCHLKMKQEYEEFKKSAKEKEIIREQMEKRTIVKQLRAKQNEVLELESELKTMGNTFHLQKRNIQFQIDNVINERNSLIVEFVKYVKNIQNMQAEMETSGQSFTSTGSEMRKLEQDKCSDSFNKLEKDQMQSVKCPDFLQELLQSKRHSTGSMPSGRSILRKETTETPPTKQVLLVTADDSSESSNEDIVMSASVTNLQKSKNNSLPKSCSTESEDVIEDEENVEENYLYPAQNASTIIDLVTPTVKETDPIATNIEKKEDGNPESKQSNKVKVVEIQENIVLSSSFLDTPMTSSKAAQFLKDNFKDFFSGMGMSNDKSDTMEPAADLDDTFTFDNKKMDLSLTENKKAFASFMDFNLDMDLDEKETDTDAMNTIGVEDFSKFFD